MTIRTSEACRIWRFPIGVTYSKQRTEPGVRPPNTAPMAHTHTVRSSRVRLDASVAVWVPVALAGGVTLIAAIASLARESLNWHDSVGIALLVAAATLAEAFPVPIEGVAGGAPPLPPAFLLPPAPIPRWGPAGVLGRLPAAGGGPR